MNLFLNNEIIQKFLLPLKFFGALYTYVCNVNQNAECL